MAKEIRDYVARARAESSTENIQALWRAVFMLKGWYFLPSEDVEGPSHPTVVVVDEQPWLIAFTNVRRLKAFAARSGSHGRRRRGSPSRVGSSGVHGAHIGRLRFGRGRDLQPRLAGDVSGACGGFDRVRSTFRCASIELMGDARALYDVFQDCMGSATVPSRAGNLKMSS